MKPTTKFFLILVAKIARYGEKLKSILANLCPQGQFAAVSDMFFLAGGYG
jgi:hypothetical protein